MVMLGVMWLLICGVLIAVLTRSKNSVHVVGAVIDISREHSNTKHALMSPSSVWWYPSLSRCTLDNWLVGYSWTSHLSCLNHSSALSHKPYGCTHLCHAARHDWLTTSAKFACSWIDLDGFQLLSNALVYSITRLLDCSMLVSAR